MDKRARQIVFILGISIIIILLISLTFAYFVPSISGTPSSNNITGTSGDLVLEYGDGSGNVTTGEFYPGDTIATKTFTVKNTGNGSISYSVVLENVTNTLTRKSDLVYTLSCSSSCSGKSETTFPSSSPTTLVTNTISANTTHSYTFTVKYKNLTAVDQVADSGAYFGGKINIKSN